MIELFATRQLVGGEHAVVKTEIANVFVKQRRLHVIARSVDQPCDRRFAAGDVARGVAADRVNGAAGAMSVGDDNQSVGEYRRRHRNVAAAFEHPQFFSGLEIVAANVMPSVNDHLPAVRSARGVRYDGWRPEGRHIVAWGAPQLFSCFDINAPTNEFFCTSA